MEAWGLRNQETVSFGEGSAQCPLLLKYQKEKAES